MKRQSRSIPPCSWSEVSTSSPGPTHRLRATMFIAVVPLLT